MTSTIYNQAFHDMIRGKKRIDPVALNVGYDSGSDSYMIPVGFNKDCTAALAKENLFRRYGTVVKAPTRDGYIQTVVSTADAKITVENMAFPEDSDTFNKISFSSYKLAVLSKLNSTFIADMNFPMGHISTMNLPDVSHEQKKTFSSMELVSMNQLDYYRLLKLERLLPLQTSALMTSLHYIFL